MQNHLTNSTAAFKAGIGTSKRIFKVTSGQYAGRIVILIQTSPSEIKLSFSDYPYISWSSPALIINDSADYPFDAVMNEEGNIYVAYTLASTNDLVSCKLTYSSGSWTAGSSCTVYNGDDNYYPSISHEPDGRLWVSWSRYSLGLYYINAKFSDDEGINWSGGPASAGTTLTSGGNSGYSKIIIRNSYVYCIYSHDGTKLAYRKKHFNITLWDSEETIAAGSGYDHNLSAAVSQDGKIGVVYDDGKIRFRENDGSSWGALLDIDSGGGDYPQIKYINNIPYLIYLSNFAAGQKKILFTRRDSSYFSTPTALDSRKNSFSKVFCYHSTSGSYQDLTAAAGNSATADIYHSGSGVMLKDSGDSIYFGLDEKFHYLKTLLATIGSGGSISWQYYNGQEWVSFVPSGGNYNFTAADKELLLWDDYSSIPSDWQKKVVNGVEKLWIKAVVSTPYTTGPTGSQITSISNISALILME
jgi:hypothetical protein